MFIIVRKFYAEILQVYSNLPIFVCNLRNNGLLPLLATAHLRGGTLV